MKEGDRIKMTDKAIKQGLGGFKPGFGVSTTGVVISYNPPFINVKRDNRKSIETYHESFWKVDTKHWEKQ